MTADNPARITRYMQTASGGHRLGLTVRGIRVTVEPGDLAQQGDVEALALAIAALGPADAPAPLSQPPRPAPPVIPPPAPVKPFAVGEHVYCKVHGAEGWRTVTAVGVDHNRGRIKVSGTRAWCPAHNFSRGTP